LALQCFPPTTVIAGLTRNPLQPHRKNTAPPTPRKKTAQKMGIMVYTILFVFASIIPIFHAVTLPLPPHAQKSNPVPFSLLPPTNPTLNRYLCYICTVKMKKFIPMDCKFTVQSVN
jgi:hypothetical protein